MSDNFIPVCMMPFIANMFKKDYGSKGPTPSKYLFNLEFFDKVWYDDPDNPDMDMLVYIASQQIADKLLAHAEIVITRKDVEDIISQYENYPGYPEFDYVGVNAAYDTYGNSDNPDIKVLLAAMDNFNLNELHFEWDDEAEGFVSNDIPHELFRYNGHEYYPDENSLYLGAVSANTSRGEIVPITLAFYFQEDPE